MKFLHPPIRLFFILQLFTPILLVWSQGASGSSAVSISSSAASGSGSTPTTTGTGTTNSTSSPSPTSSAQFPSLSGVSTCVSDCLAEASSNLNCTSVVDVNCFCNNTDYPAQLLDCVLGNCPDQVSTIETLGQEFCNQASGQPTLSYFSVPNTSTSSLTSSSSSTLTSTSTTPTSTSTAPSSSSTTTNSAAKSSTSLMGLGAIMVLVVILAV